MWKYTYTTAMSYLKGSIKKYFSLKIRFRIYIWSFSKYWKLLVFSLFPSVLTVLFLLTLDSYSQFFDGQSWYIRILILSFRKLWPNKLDRVFNNFTIFLFVSLQNLANCLLNRLEFMNLADSKIKVSPKIKLKKTR